MVAVFIQIIIIAAALSPGFTNAVSRRMCFIDPFTVPSSPVATLLLLLRPSPVCEYFSKAI